MEIKKENITEQEIPDGIPYVKDKKGKKIPINLESPKEFILINDLKQGFEIQLISNSQSMEQLILSALTLKLNLLDNKEKLDRDYIG